MKVHVDRVNDAYHFVGRNENGIEVHMDASPKIGGGGEGAGPMQLLLMGIGGCSGIDIVGILNKMKQPLEDLKIEIDGEREEGGPPSLYTKVDVIFRFTGEMDPERVKHATDLSMQKYCSVTKTIEKTAVVNYTVELNGEQI